MGGRGSSSMSKTYTSYKSEVMSSMREEAQKLNGTDQVGIMRSDSAFNRIAFRTRDNYMTPGRLQDYAKGTNRPLGMNDLDWQTVQESAAAVIKKYGAKKAAAFYMFGHLLEG